MAKDTNKKMSVFSDVITSLAYDAASGVDGIQVLAKDGKKSFRGCGVSVYFLPNDKVTIDLFVNIQFGYLVPPTVATVQERVKAEVENSTKYQVHSVNVQVVDVIYPQ